MGVFEYDLVMVHLPSGSWRSLSELTGAQRVKPPGRAAGIDTPSCCLLHLSLFPLPLHHLFSPHTPIF